MKGNQSINKKNDLLVVFNYLFDKIKYNSNI